jgi:adenosine deaminase
VIGARDPRIVEHIRREGVVLDVCPTANWKCKAVPTMAEHPLPRLVREGVRCTISTDSRTVAATTLTREFELMSGEGMTDEELRRCNNVAYESRFG